MSLPTSGVLASREYSRLTCFLKGNESPNVGSSREYLRLTRFLKGKESPNVGSTRESRALATHSFPEGYKKNSGAVGSAARYLLCREQSGLGSTHSFPFRVQQVRGCIPDSRMADVSALSTHGRRSTSECSREHGQVLLSIQFSS
jgi:hypothetical protein